MLASMKWARQKGTPVFFTAFFTLRRLFFIRTEKRGLPQQIGHCSLWCFSLLKFILWLQREPHFRDSTAEGKSANVCPSPLLVTKNVLTSFSAYIWLPAFFSEKPCPKEHTAVCTLLYPKRVVDRELFIPPPSHIITDAILNCHSHFVLFILCGTRLVLFLKPCLLQNKMPP